MNVLRQRAADDERSLAKYVERILRYALTDTMEGDATE